MRTRRILSLLAASAFVCAFIAHAQDSQFLGDAARQARLQKQQKEAPPKDASVQSSAQNNKDAHSPASSGTDAPAKDAPASKTSHVITNDEIHSHVGPAVTASSAKPSSTPDAAPNSGDKNAQAEQWTSQIKEQKNAIASLQSEITELSDSVHYAGGNCVANCVEWNERQKEKQNRVETLKAQLEEQKQQLEDLQESARKQGFGSSVYDQ
jgi:hypothetical protein